MVRGEILLLTLTTGVLGYVSHIKKGNLYISVHIDICILIQVRFSPDGASIVQNISIFDYDNFEKYAHKSCKWDFKYKCLLKTIYIR